MLYRYWNELLPYRQNVIDPSRGKRDAWLNANAYVAPIDGSQKIDDGHLGFLLDVQKGDQFAQLMLQQDRFAYSVYMIEDHSRALLDAHEAISAQGIKRGQGLRDEELQKILGPFLCLRLETLWAGVVDATDRNLVSFKESFEKLRAMGIELFPDAHFIDVDFADKAEGTTK